MTDFSTLLQQGVANAWLFIPSAILLGALHGLEPGHSKTMMAAFIVAIRGTVKQAVLLGLAATISHTSVVWLIAFGGMYISQKFTAESAEPWFQLISAVIILGTAAWMFWPAVCAAGATPSCRWWSASWAAACSASSGSPPSSGCSTPPRCFTSATPSAGSSLHWCIWPACWWYGIR